MLVAACRRDEYCSPGGVATRCNEPTKTVTVTAPTRFGAPRSVRSGCGPCLGPDGTCSVRPMIRASAAYGVVDGDTLEVMLSLPAREGPASYAFSPSNPDLEFVLSSVDPDLNGYDFVPLTPVSGTIVVEHLTPDAFTVNFDLQLETSDHEAFSIDSHCEIAGCELFSYPAECHPYD